QMLILYLRRNNVVMKLELSEDLSAELAGLPTASRNGAEILIDTLIQSGVDTVFGYPGGAALPLYDALFERPGLRHVLVRHEQAAVRAAQGYARTTGKIGVVLVTSGPGMSNTITGLLDAHSDSVPILCISGQVARPLIGSRAFQECDAIGLAMSVTKGRHQLGSAAEIEEVVQRSLALAKSGRPGPVLIDVPKDVQLEIPALPARAGSPEPAVGAHEPVFTDEPVLAVPAGTAVLEAVRMLVEARRPVLYGGGGL